MDDYLASWADQVVLRKIFIAIIWAEVYVAASISYVGGIFFNNNEISTQLRSKRTKVADGPAMLKPSSSNDCQSLGS